MPMFFIIPIFSSIIFFVVFTIITISIIKAAKNKNLFVNMDEQFKDLKQNATKISQRIFNPELIDEIKNEKHSTCEYCGSSVDYNVKKCPNCSANIKTKK